MSIGANRRTGTRREGSQTGSGEHVAAELVQWASRHHSSCIPVLPASTHIPEPLQSWGQSVAHKHNAERPAGSQAQPLLADVH